MTNPTLDSLSARLSLGAPQVFRNLVVVPLLDGTAPPTGWLTLGQAIARGLAEVSEISEQGSVPQLKLLNRATEPLFLLDGEELVGAKQNRILNLSLLAPAGADLDIPVSCVEQGRWSWRSSHFEDAQRVIFSKLRASNSDAVSDSLLHEKSTRGDQGRVWEDISIKAARMSIHSDTGAAAALFERHSPALDDFVAGIEAQPGQVGAAFLVNGRFAGLDLFAGPDLLRELLPRLVRSYALDAIEDARPTTAGIDAIKEAVRSALEQAGKLEVDRGAPLGLGESLRLRGTGFAGSSLVAAGAMAHLSLWSAEWR
ncbi:MAG: hypothetical protein LCH95_17460 [Proteobacteria bacterium]|nr:hypothetical protein [Pseudomonadota bacterium]